MRRPRTDVDVGALLKSLEKKQGRKYSLDSVKMSLDAILQQGVSTTQASEMYGINRSTLQFYLKKLNVVRRRWRQQPSNLIQPRQPQCGVCFYVCSLYNVRQHRDLSVNNNMPLIDSEPFDSILLCFLVFSFPRFIINIYIYFRLYIHVYTHHTYYIKNWISARNELQRKCSLVTSLPFGGGFPSIYCEARQSGVEWSGVTSDPTLNVSETITNSMITHFYF